MQNRDRRVTRSLLKKHSHLGHVKALLYSQRSTISFVPQGLRLSSDKSSRDTAELQDKIHA